MPKIWKILPIAFALSGCGAGSGDGLDDNGLPVDDSSNDGSDSGVNTTLAQIQNEIFSPICAQCHVGAAAPRGLRLDSIENSINFLINVDSDQVPGVFRVAPGDADNSYIVQKIEGAPGIVGSQMPLGMPPLSTAQITLIRDWINAGAPTQSKPSITKVQHVQINDEIDQINFSLLLNAESPSLENIHHSLVVEKEVGESWVVARDDEYSVDTASREINIRYSGDFEGVGGLSINLNSPSNTVLHDAQGKVFDGDNDQQEGGEFRYEYHF